MESFHQRKMLSQHSHEKSCNITMIQHEFSKNLFTSLNGILMNYIRKINESSNSEKTTNTSLSMLQI